MPDLFISPNIKSFCSAADYSDMRTQISLVVGTNVQAYSATLDNVTAGTYTGNANISTVGTIGTGTWSASTVGLSYGGTGATTDSAARTALGLVIGTNVQAYYPALSSFDPSTYTGDSSITTLSTVSTGTWSATEIDIPYGGTNATNATDARQNLGLEIGVDVQAYSSNLASLVSGTIDNITIGATTPSTGKFTTLESQTGKICARTAFKNRIINGDMRIDQRNEGSSVNSNGNYSCDRWQLVDQGTGAFTLERSTIAPTGFTYSLKATVTTSDTSLGTTEFYTVRQNIEGLFTSDLLFGTANAKTITISFWVRSSLTGTFGGSLRNQATSRSYPFSYSISVADTWEYKTVTIAGAPTGTWETDIDIGIGLSFALGAGSDRSGTAGAWNTDNNVSVTSATNVMGTLSATWYITGVQFEHGATATEFEYRSFARELALCQRYYEKSFDVGTAPAQNAGLTNAIRLGQLRAGTSVNEHCGQPISYQRVKRYDSNAAPTVTTFNPSAANAQIRNVTDSADGANTTVVQNNKHGFSISYDTSAAGARGEQYAIHYTCDADY